MFLAAIRHAKRSNVPIIAHFPQKSMIYDELRVPVMLPGRGKIEQG